MEGRKLYWGDLFTILVLGAIIGAAVAVCVYETYGG